ncbi:amino acid/polyamine transporter I [Mycotypha africana]|uniref:amino acid/polyamine transporter I n=1 Tax=Mycotypha africana TaxID=64632 RepID=UPI0023008FB8|nr:amino acid/polyamine transporter I [Mycotypha africana]KAI8984585.1 amino acid/polyamine transporter I [Mycotypha africana]
MDAIASLNKLNVFWSCFGLVGIIALLAMAAHHQQFSWVFTHYENRTGIDNSGYVLVLGMVGAAFSLFGCESAASVSEETKDADRSSPIAMVSSITIAWFVGFAYLIILLFSIQDIDAIFDTKFHLPVAQLFLDASGVYSTVVFLLLMTVCQLCSGATSMTVTSRLIYALARDHAAPKSHQLKSLNKHALPSNAVWLTAIFTILIVSPFPMSEHLYDTIVSASTITVHFSYAMVLGSRLLAPEMLGRKGRFSLGRWSKPITLIGFSWAVFATLAFILPTEWPITSKNFNYAGLGLLFVLLFAATFWCGWGKYHYHGPQASNDEA